jgi:hypothetical protein
LNKGVDKHFVKFFIYLFIDRLIHNAWNLKVMAFSHDGYVDKNKSKHITELQITKSKQINRKQMHDNPPPSVAGFTHSGDEAPLVDEKNRIQHRSEHGGKMEGQRREEGKADIRP